MSGDPLIPAGLAAEANRVSWTIAHRLADDGVVQHAVRSMAELDDPPPPWGGPGLYGGYAGSALVFRYAARVSRDAEDRWCARSRSELKRAVSVTREQPLTQSGLGIGTA